MSDKIYLPSTAIAINNMNNAILDTMLNAPLLTEPSQEMGE